MEFCVNLGGDPEDLLTSLGAVNKIQGKSLCRHHKPSELLKGAEMDHLPLHPAKCPPSCEDSCNVLSEMPNVNSSHKMHFSIFVPSLGWHHE